MKEQNGPGLKNYLRRKILKNYLRYNERINRRIFKRFAIPLFGGLHPKNIFNFRSEFFMQNVDGNDAVIDVGCGTGLILSRIAPLIKKGYGIEMSKDCLEICNTRHSAENLKYINGDLLRIDYEALKKETGYTIAIFSHILEHIEDAPALLSKVDADKLLICVPSQENWHTQLLVYLGLPCFSDDTHFREYTREMLKEELALTAYHIDFIGFNAEGEIICKATK